jgi:hypothetical protein
MKRRFAAALSIFALMASVGWTLASHPETSAGLKDVSLIEHSEHSHPGPKNSLAGIRIRLSPSDFSYEISATARKIPQVSLIAE